MADLLREIFDWVATDAALARAVDWHCGHLPTEAVAPMAVLLERGGMPSQPTIRGNVGEYMFQVLTVSGLNGSYMDGRDLAYRVSAVLSDRAGKQLADHTIWVVDAVAGPQFLGMDERFRFQFSQNFAVRAITDDEWGY
jgi:hypothetical protein